MTTSRLDLVIDLLLVWALRPRKPQAANADEEQSGRRLVERGRKLVRRGERQIIRARRKLGRGERLLNEGAAKVRQGEALLIRALGREQLAGEPPRPLEAFSSRGWWVASSV